MAAQELVCRRQLRPNLGGVATRHLRLRFGFAQGATRLLGAGVGLFARLARRRKLPLQLLRTRLGRLLLGAQPLDLALGVTLALLVYLSKRGLERPHAILAGSLLCCGGVGPLLAAGTLLQRPQLDLDARRPLGDGLGGSFRLLAAHL